MLPFQQSAEKAEYFVNHRCCLTDCRFAFLKHRDEFFCQEAT